jgi:redox-sensitive bicupin YhaK (pirin superfamily)
MAVGKSLVLEESAFERALYVVSGGATVDGVAIETGSMALLETGRSATLAATQATRCVVIGGEALEGHRHIWWNFVSSSRERIEQAKQEWVTQTAAKIPGETEWIPLPVK